MRIDTLGLAVGLFGMLTFSALAQSTAITYQGQLKQDGIPLSGVVDMRFQLFDSDTAETPVAGPIVFDGLGSNPPPVEVSNGLFAVAIDFGSEAYAQSGRWLQVEVRSPSDPGDTEPYTALSPRQEITAVPFALSVPGLSTTPAGGVEVEGNIHTPGEVVASAFSSNSPLIFKVNPANVECARFDDANCYFGLGVVAPQALLHLGGIPGVDGVMFPDGTLQTTAAGTVVGGDSLWSLTAGNDIFYDGGNVGVGTSAPAAKLDIAATGDGAELLRFSTDRPWVFRQIRTGSVTGLELRSTVGIKLFEITAMNGTNVATFVADDANPRMGIGTIAPNHRLSISGGPLWTSNAWSGSLELDNAGAIAWRKNASGQGFGIGQSGGGLYFFRTASDPAVITSPANYEMVISDAGRVGVGTTVPQRELHVSTSELFTARFEGSQTSAAVVEFRSSSSGDTWEYGVSGSAPPFGLGSGDLYFFRQGNTAPGLTISRDNFVAQVGCADFKMGHTSRRGAPGRALVDNGDHLVINFARDWGRTAVHGLLQVNALQILGGADLSEQFDIAPAEDATLAAGGDLPDDAASAAPSAVEPGAVVCIDAGNPGKLVVCTAAYDHTVAGVVSGAGGVNPGMTMGQEGSIADGQHPVALTGRVYTLCDAASGAIQPGDLLTTAESGGHAMKAVDRDRSHGAIIGKAMSSLAEGERGLVLVLVNLQ